SATIKVLHEKLDPFQQAAIDIASRLAVQEVNASVLSALVGGAQTALAPLDRAASTLTEQAAALTDAVGRGDTAAMATAAGAVAGTLTDATTVMAASQDVIERLGGDAGATADVLTTTQAAADEAAAIAAGGGSDLSARAT